MGIVDRDDLRQSFRLGFLEAKAKGMDTKHAYTSAWTRAKAYKRAAIAYYMRKQCIDCGNVYSWYSSRCGRCGCRTFAGIGYKSGIGFDLVAAESQDAINQLEYEQFCTLLNTEERFILDKVSEKYTQKQIADILQLTEDNINYRFSKIKRKYHDFIKG